jgi:hypothetical protein
VHRSSLHQLQNWRNVRDLEIVLVLLELQVSRDHEGN